jgi:hypothetical protein
MFAVSLMGSIGVIVVSIVFAFDHAEAAMAYGVSLAGGTDNAWISSAAVRDLAFGCLALAFAVLRDRRGMDLCLLFGALIPVGDAIIVLRNSPTPLMFLPLHVGGAVGCLVLAGTFLYPSRH